MRERKSHTKTLVKNNKHCQQRNELTKKQQQKTQKQNKNKKTLKTI